MQRSKRSRLVAPNMNSVIWLAPQRAEAPESASAANRRCLESSENGRLTLTRSGSRWNTLEKVSLRIAQTDDPLCRSAESTERGS